MKNDPLQAAHDKFLAHTREFRREEAQADVPEYEARAHHLARESLASVFPHLPGMIDEFVGQADARIYSREDLRKMLSDFAVRVLLTQSGSVMRWFRAVNRRKAAGKE